MSTAPQAGGGLPPTRAYRETNGLAIASLILGILAIVPVAIVLGIIALVQIGRRGDSGKGLAIAGIAISCTWVVIAIVGVIVLVNNIIERDADGRIVEAGLVDELSLVPGDCVNDPDEDAICFANFEPRRRGPLGGVSGERAAAAGLRGSVVSVPVSVSAALPAERAPDGVGHAA